MTIVIIVNIFFLFFIRLKMAQRHEHVFFCISKPYFCALSGFMAERGLDPEMVIKYVTLMKDLSEDPWLMDKYIWSEQSLGPTDADGKNGGAPDGDGKNSGAFELLKSVGTEWNVNYNGIKWNNGKMKEWDNGAMESDGACLGVEVMNLD